jgi:transposase
LEGAGSRGAGPHQAGVRRRVWHSHLAGSRVWLLSQRGERLKLSVPRNRGENTTLLASMTVEGMGPSMAVEGSTTKGVFEAYLEHVLLPELEEGQVLIMDKLAAHKRAKVRELIEGRGLELLYLPSYSPEYNPIEEAFSKVKEILRRACARTREALLEALGEALSAVSLRDAWGFFEHAGYHPVGQLL